MLELKICTRQWEGTWNPCFLPHRRALACLICRSFWLCGWSIGLFELPVVSVDVPKSIFPMVVQTGVDGVWRSNFLLRIVETNRKEFG